MKRTIFTVTLALVFSSIMFAQIRPTDQTGINIFETPKTPTEFNGLKVDIGGAFALPYMALSHSNSLGAYSASNPNTLFPVAHNFALSMANLYLNTQLADGVTLNFTLYLASKHHNETWVKGGYIQFDKVPFIHLDLLDNIMKFTTFKVGQMEVNYGDAHFRRSDGGNAIYNPFMENYIMDEFATEIGAEADFHFKDFIAVAAITDGELNPDLQKVNTVKDSVSNGSHNPAFIAKLGYDKQVTEKLRVRLTGSVYYTAGSIKNTLFGGDRSGSNYSGVMYNAAPGTGTAFNGRYNPGFSDKITTAMGNLFLKYKPMDWLAVESFTTYEKAKGRTTVEPVERKATQIASDLVFRFGKNENFFAGVRYNTLKADAPKAVISPIQAVSAKAVVYIDNNNHALGIMTPAVAAVAYVPGYITPAYTAAIDRLAVSAGWFITKNIMAKVEYANQTYSGFPTGNIYDGGEFHGLSAEAVIAF